MKEVESTWASVDRNRKRTSLANDAVVSLRSELSKIRGARDVLENQLKELREKYEADFRLG